MLYESYRRKIEQIAKVFKVIWKIRYIILGIVSLAFFSTGGYLAVKGNVSDKVECPTTIVYGEDLGYKAKGLFSDIVYQYSSDPSFATYSEEMPRMPGVYYVRAASNGSFKTVKYGEVYSFQILKKTIDVIIAESTWTYGDSPSVSANVSYGDIVYCSSFHYSNLGLPNATVTPVMDSIWVTDANGKDVSVAYEFNVVERTVALKPRDLTVTVGSAEKTYDSLPLQFTGYEVTSGNLVSLISDSADSILATYSSSITEVGETPNLAVNLRVRTSSGVDVTHLYNITIIEGKLTVNKRPVIFNIESSEIIYDAEEHPDIDYEIDEETPLLDGHIEECIPIVPAESDPIINAGKYQVNQYVDFKISYTDDSANKIDVTNNYFIFLPEDAYVEILKRDITVTTPSETWTYDDEAHSNGDFSVSDTTESSGLVPGHTHEFSEAIEIIYASSVQNETTLTITDSNGNDVTANYNVIEEFGELTINKRPISITTESKSWIYDANKHFADEWAYTDTSVSDDFKIISGHTTSIPSSPFITNVAEGEMANEFEISIKDANGNYVTDNYEISYTYGTIKIEKRPVYVLTGSGTLIYNGAPQYILDWSYQTFDGDDVELFELVSSHHTVVNEGYSTFTNVTNPDDNNENKFSLSVFNDADIDVSDNYDIHYDYGTITILHRSIYVVTDSERFVYDAAAHSVPRWDYAEATTDELRIVDSHNWEISGLLTFTNVQETSGGNNIFELIIKDADGEDVTENYDIKYDYGTITILKREIHISTSTIEQVYDGLTYTFDKWTYGENSPYMIVSEGGIQHQAKLESYVTRKNYTDIPLINEVVISILDENGEDVTENYDIKYTYGTITILKREIHISTSTIEQVYDGLTYTFDKWTYGENSPYMIVSEGGIQHQAKLESYVTRKNYTDIPLINEVVISILDENGDNVTENYDIKYDYGTITILKREIHISTSTIEQVYDGLTYTFDKWTYGENSPYMIVSEGGIQHQAKLESYVTRKNYTETPLTNEVVISILDENGDDVTENYDIKYTYGTITILKREIHISTSTIEQVYDGLTYTFDKWTYGENSPYMIVSEGGIQHQAKLESYVTRKNYTETPLINEVVISILDENGEDVTENYDIKYTYGTITILKREIHISTSTIEQVYDGLTYTFDKWTYGENSPYMIVSEGGIQHQAKLESYVTRKNYTETPLINEVVISILDENGEDVTENYDIKYDYGTITIHQREINISTPTIEQVYDGIEYAFKEWSCSGVPYGIIDNEKVKHHAEIKSYVTLKNATTNPEVYKVELIIRDENGDNVTSNYDIKYDYGTITILKREIHISTPTIEQVYDGIEYAFKEWSYGAKSPNYIVSSDDVKHTVSIVSFVTAKNFTETPLTNEVILAILDENDVDVTENYDIKYDYGTITVNKRTIEIITDSHKWVYDGSEHSAPNFGYQNVADGINTFELVDGHTYSALNAPSVSVVADDVVENKFTLIIKDAEGNDVTSNYDINYAYGTIEILPRHIHILTDSKDLPYNDDKQSVTTFTYIIETENDFELVEGHSYEAINPTFVSAVSDIAVENKFTIIIRDAEGNDVTRNYNIEYSYGFIKVIPRSIYIITGSEKFVYDGTTHSLPTFSYEVFQNGTASLELVEGHTYETVNAPSVSKVTDGVVENNFTIIIKDAKGNDVTSNYDIHYKCGTIEVIKREIHISTPTIDQVYDGLTYQFKEWSYGENSTYQIISEGGIQHQAKLESWVTRKNYTDFPLFNEVVISILDENGDDVTENYDIKYNYGTITIHQREIHISTPTIDQVYDGIEYAFKEWSCSGVPYGIIDNEEVKHHAEIKSYVKLKNATTVPEVYKVELIIRDENGDNVTANYDIKYDYGTITIHQRKIHISTPTIEQVYDGVEYAFKEWSCSGVPYGIIDNEEVKHHAEIKSYVKLKNATTKPEVYKVELIIRDENGDNVTANYDIEYDYGTITIKKRSIFIQTGSSEPVYDDELHYNDTWGYDGDIDNETRFEMVSTHTVTSENVPKFQYVPTEDVNNNNIFSIKIWDGEENVTDNYDIHYSYGTVRIKQRVIHISTASDSWTYDGKEHWNTNWNYMSDTPYKILGENEGENKHTFEVVYYPIIKSIGEVDNALVIVILDEDEKDVTWNYDFQIKDMGVLSITPREIIVTTATNRWEYDGEEHCDPRFTLSESTPLLEGDKLSVVGYTIVKDVNYPLGVENILTFKILSADGEDVTGNYKIIQHNGTLTITDCYIEITPDDVSKEYDRTPLTPEGFTITFGTLKAGHTLVLDELVLIGSQTEIGTSDITIDPSSIKIVDSEGNDVTENYIVDLKTGTLEVTKIHLDIIAGSASKPYDGTPITSGEFTYTGNILDGHFVYAETTGTQTEVGSSGNIIIPDSVRIYNENDVDVSEFYDVTLVDGTLTIQPCAIIKITTGSATKEYDRNPLTNDFYEKKIIEGAFFPGDYIVIKVTGSQTDVGSSENTVEVDILNANGESVLHRYEIEYDLGTLEVTKRKITVITGGKWKIYDGTPLTCSESIIVNLLKGHTYTLTITGLQIDAGTSKNTADEESLKILDEYGNDVTDTLYEVTFDYGNLIVAKRDLTVTTGSATKVYDALPLTSVSFSNDGNLVSGHRLTLTTIGSQTNVGISENIIEDGSVKITDRYGNTVTHNYEITYVLGTLTVTPKPVTITTGSASKVYDGTPLTCDTVNVTGVLSIHSFTLDITGTQTEVGSSTNNVSNFIIVDGEGNDVTFNYEVTYQLGTLTVNKIKVTITTGSANKVYDGTPLIKDEFSITGVLGTHSHTPIIVTGSQTDAGKSDNTVNSSDFRIFDANGDDITHNYEITYNLGTLTVAKAPLKITTGSASQSYNGTTLTCNEYNVTGLLGEHSISLTINGAQKEVGRSENTILEGSVVILDASNNDVTANYDISYSLGWLVVGEEDLDSTEIRPLELTPNSVNREYDGTEATPDNVIITNGALKPNHKIVIDEIVFIGSQTIPGTAISYIQEGTVKIVDKDGHDVTEEYEITLATGTITVTKRCIVFTSGSATKVYDGTPLTSNEFTVDKLISTHTITYTATGTQTNAGESANTYLEESVCIFDQGGNNVTEYYEITYELGTLTVTKRPVTVITGSASKVYDGTPLTCDEFEVSGILGIHTFTLTMSGSQTDAGESQNTVSEGGFIILDADNNDVTENYDVTYIFGTLRVTKRPITITTGSDAKIYDGTPLTCDQYTVENLVTFHKISMTINGSQTDAGKSDNTILAGSVKIIDENENEVTHNYEISYELGVLIVAKRPITFTSGSATKEYDGTPLTCDKFTVENLVKGHEASYTATGSQTEIGESVNTYSKDSVKILDKDERDVTHNYEITYEYGTLTVTKRTVTVITGSAEKIYDSTPLTCEEYSSKNLLSGHSLTLITSGSQTLPGSSQNTVLAGSIQIVDEDGNDVSEYYELKYSLGTLKVVHSNDVDNPGEDDSGDSGGGSGEGGSGEGGSGEGGSGEGGSGEGGSGEGGSGEGGSGEGGSGEGGSGEGGDGEGGSGEGGDGEGGDGEGGDGEGGDGEGGDGEGGSGEGGEGGSGEGGSGEGGEGGSGEGGSGGGGSGGGFGGNLDQSGDIGLGGNGSDFPGGSDYDPTPRVVLEIKSTATGTVYLRLTSFGEFTGNKWMPATAYESYIIENYGFNYLVALALKLAEVGKEHQMQIKSFTTDYLLPYFISMSDGNYVIQGSDVSNSGTHNGEYSMSYYVYNGDFTGLNVDLDTLSDVERLYSEFVHTQYCEIDTTTYNFILNIINAQGWSKDDPDIIAKVQKYVQNCATYNLSYDRNLDKEDNIVTAFLGDEYTEGICQHYASAATMIFRALGIPARYTIGYVGNTVAGQWTQVTAETAHAWTEVYIDGIGWIPVEVTGAGAGGNVGGGNLGGDNEDGEENEIPDFNLDDLPKELIIKPVDVSKEYDGTPLYPKNEIEATYNSLIERLLSMGFTYEVEVRGSQTEVGVSESMIVYFKLYDPNGVDVTDEFEITYLPGEIRVTLTQVIIVLYDIKKEYDGTSISYAPGDYWIKQIPEGFTLVFHLEGSMTDVGEYDIEALRNLKYTIYNENGEDVTPNYYLEIEGKGLIVTRRYIEITSASVTREYNGKELKDSTVTVTFGSLVAGHRLICDVTGSITEVGATTNQIKSYTIVDQNGNDVTNFYEVVKNEGILKVTKGPNV